MEPSEECIQRQLKSVSEKKCLKAFRGRHKRKVSEASATLLHAEALIALKTILLWWKLYTYRDSEDSEDIYLKENLSESKRDIIFLKKSEERRILKGIFI